MSIRKLKESCGSLSKPSKMPGYAFSISAHKCKVGSQLVKIKGSVCHDCYALKNRYLYPNVQDAQEYRYEKLMSNPFWEFDIAEYIRLKRNKWFRWHSSGDLQSIDHLKKIIAVANLLPDVMFWLPTRENNMVKTYLKRYGEFPDNLCVRVSNHMLNSYKSAASFDNSSAVVTSWDYAIKGYNCPSKYQDSSCGECRVCWDKNIKIVNYFKH